MQLDIDKARVIWLLQGNRGRKKIEKDPNAEDKEKPYVCEGWNWNDLLFLVVEVYFHCNKCIIKMKEVNIKHLHYFMDILISCTFVVLYLEWCRVYNVLSKFGLFRSFIFIFKKSVC